MSAPDRTGEDHVAPLVESEAGVSTEHDDARQAVAHWLDRNYGPATHAMYGDGHDWLAAADDVLEVARANAAQADVSRETDTTNEVARVLAENSPCIWSISQPEHPYGKDFCLDTHPDKHPGVGFCWVLPTKQAKALAEAGLLRRVGTDHLAEDLRENTEALIQARAQIERVSALANRYNERQGTALGRVSTGNAAFAICRALAGDPAERAPTREPECPCAACDPGMMLDAQYMPIPSRMNVCPDCGNKRCPKAANHAVWQCSGSNTVGQVGVPTEQGNRG